jgi:3-methyladenine DNA glycosylase AlkD
VTCDEILAWLKKKGSKKNIAGMARYAIVAPKVFGVSVGTLRDLAKRIGRDHALAQELWATGWYEARMLAAFVDEPAKVTVKQMNAWARDFDNWAICDHCCFHLFDRTPHAYKQAAAWTKSPKEFVKRAGFALMASLALHQKKASDELFLPFLSLIEKAATDDRNFVKKGVNWALRGIGRRSAALNKPAVTLAKKLGDSDNATARWVGKDALRDFAKAKARLETQ